ncbi:hypothetical protein ACFXK0_23255 [Nocardia sp. NPDC059177]|uniref:hypothetical protein n=1 Tax=Nocardia sp. NPDC059177 TaxID=3346759 RepID=UPI0036A12098
MTDPHANVAGEPGETVDPARTTAPEHPLAPGLAVAEQPPAPRPPRAGSGARAARRLAALAAVRLLDAPAAAEEQLRRALVVGAGELAGRELAELRTQLVTAVAAQPGRDRDTARAAAAAAACWQPISPADSAHLWLVAGRAWHRAGRHAEAVTAFDRPLLTGPLRYPPGELAQVRAEFAESLNRLGRYRQAAWQFAEAARLLATIPAERHRHADLVWSSAVARECCGQESAALGLYLRAAGLWGEQDRIVPRARCLRAAAWLQLRGPQGRVRGPWWITVDVLMRELNRLVAENPAAHVVDELARTRAQFAQMCAQASRPGDQQPR